MLDSDSTGHPCSLISPVTSRRSLNCCTRSVEFVSSQLSNSRSSALIASSKYSVVRRRNSSLFTRWIPHVLRYYFSFDTLRKCDINSLQRFVHSLRFAAEFFRHVSSCQSVKVTQPDYLTRFLTQFFNAIVECVDSCRHVSGVALLKLGVDKFQDRFIKQCGLVFLLTNKLVTSVSKYLP